MKNNGLKIGLLMAGMLSMTLALGEAPVVDATSADSSLTSQTPTAESPPSATAAQAGDVNTPATTVSPNNPPANAAPPTADLSPEQRLNRLEQQMNNLTAMNLPQQVTELQGQIDQLRGTLQVEQHDLKVMNDQQKSFYQDLDQRLTQLKNGGNAAASTPATPPSAASTAAANDGAQLKDSGAYQAAFNLLENKEYDKAETSFLAYVSDFPNGLYVANAHYWLGEIYFAKKDNDKAVVEFKTVIDKFPQSVKVPDAKLKIAIVHQQAGNVAQARVEFLQIKQQYPGSTAAQLANIRINSALEK